MAAPAKPHFILASASPRRLDLLAQIGVTPVRVCAMDVDETLIPQELPRAAVERLALAKAEAACKVREGDDGLVLTADTLVACGRRILGKPVDDGQAGVMLDLLSGRRHQVISAVCLVGRGDEITRRTVVTRVSFKRLSTEEKQAYLASGEWQGKAGGYAIQGLAGSFVRALEGSYSNVVGLPLHETANLLVGAGYPLLGGWAAANE